MGDEAEALSDQYDDTSDIIKEWRDQDIPILLKRYNKARKAPVRAEIHCPVCNRKMIKKSYQHVFDRNKGKGNCKDQFWNYTDDSRYYRCRQYGK
jgi:hypothetical protein